MGGFVHTGRHFPQTRLRRLRASPWMRALVAENRLDAADLVQPFFVREASAPKTIPNFPGISRYTVDELLKAAEKCAALGIPAIALFPYVEKKNLEDAYRVDNLVGRAIAAIKKEKLPLGIIADVALDPYTPDGQDGIVKNGRVKNDTTLAALGKQALALAEAGADILAPSDMMDGRVGYLRTALDKEGYKNLPILSYAAKYASAFYGPFREAVGSKKALGQADKRTYQMDAANVDEALHEVVLDLAEGADMVMVKPALPYLDVIRAVKEQFRVPVFAYQVSGEYVMIKHAAKLGALSEKQAFLETLLGCKRAGASAILTYAAMEVAAWLNE